MSIGHRSLLWLAGFAVAASACSSSDQPAICNAATDLAVVNGAVITCEDLYELRPDYGEPADTLDSEAVREDLNRLIQTEVFITTAAEEFGFVLDVSAVEARLANPPPRWSLVLSPFGQDGAPRPRGELRLDATTTLVRDAVVPELIRAEYGRIEDFVAQRPQDVVQVCVRVIVLESEGDGIDVINRLDAGETFEDLQRETSIDQSSDGLVTIEGRCPINVAGAGEEFALATALAPLDQPAGPIALGGLFVVFRVEERVAPTPGADLDAEILELLSPAAQSTLFSPWASDALRDAEIEVASSIGRWSSAGFGIAPPGFNPPGG